MRRDSNSCNNMKVKTLVRLTLVDFVKALIFLFFVFIS